MNERDDITVLLSEASTGKAPAVERLYPLVYDELRRLAQSHLQRERVDHTLQATALVNEAYMKLIDQTRVDWQNRSHFFAIASRAIRRILVDYARARGREKRGGGWQRVGITGLLNAPVDGPSIDMLALNEALERLASDHPDKVNVVEMRFFSGLNNEEIAAVMNVSTRTVERHWQFARAWLYRELTNNS